MVEAGGQARHATHHAAPDPAPPGFPGAAGTLQLWHASGSLHGSLPTRDRDGHPELEVVGEHRTRLL